MKGRGIHFLYKFKEGNRERGANTGSFSNKKEKDRGQNLPVRRERKGKNSRKKGW